MSGTNRPAAGPKKGLTVPTMSRNMTMTEEQAKETWSKLEAAIAMIHKQNASSLSFEELYRYAYNMVLHRHAAMLYAGMESSLRSHLQGIVQELQTYTDMAFMRQLLLKWINYHKSTQLIRDILMYMDKTYVKNFQRKPAYQRGMEIWTEEIIQTEEVGGLLRKLFLEQVAKERAGDVVDRNVLIDFTKMMMALGKQVYATHLEKPFIDASRTHYESESTRFLQTMDCPSYFKAVEAQIKAEEERADTLLDPALSKDKLLRALLDVYVASQLDTVLKMEGSGFVCLLNDDRLEDLKRVYSIVGRIDVKGPHFIRDLMATHIKDVGKALVAESEAAKDASAFAQKVLDLRDKYTRIIAHAFASDRKFLNALNSSFEAFLNAFPRSAEYVSLYIDGQLRKGLTSASDQQADDLLDKVLQIFRYLHDKDMFERFYKQHLSKRLLAGRVTNDSVEQLMLQKLKTECGYQFTCKLEGMFTDMKTSEDTMRSFRQHLKDKDIDLRAEISVHVLTTGSWPAAAGKPCNLPQELEASTAAFDDFYRAKHSGRKLTWHSQLGTADLGCTIQGKRHTITVTTHQMCCLMLLNGQGSITFKELLDATNIERDDLKPALIGLSMVKGKMLLKKTPASKEISDSDAFSFNERFKSPHLKIKFAAAGAQKESEIASGVRQKVEEDRKHIIEAAVVRIMKARRVLDYNSIVAEVTRHMSGRFVPMAADIKKRIEGLIERDFLERDPNDRTTYRYVA